MLPQLVCSMILSLQVMRCPCDRDHNPPAPQLNAQMVKRLEILLELVDTQITSGFRCAYHNNLVSGATSSQHMLGAGVDLRVTTQNLTRILHLALLLGFTGVGLYKNHIHLDVRPGNLVYWENR